MKTLFVTDFDDTLAKTDANVYVTKSSGKTLTLSPEEYAVYEPKPDDKFDYSEFEQLKNPRELTRFTGLLKKVIDDKKADKVTVLTARGHTKPIALFLRAMGITSGVSIAALGDATPERKANYIEKHIKDGYGRVLFIDDSPKNIKAVEKLRDRYPEVKLATHQVKSKQEPTKPVKAEEPPKTTKAPEKQMSPTSSTPDQYSVGQTWQTSGGNWGGKNKRGEFKYFDSQDKANKFAKT